MDVSAKGRPLAPFANRNVTRPSPKDFNQQASSAVHNFLQNNVPMLATRRITQAYQYVDDESIVIRRPQGVREMDAILALRTGAPCAPILFQTLTFSLVLSSGC